jgi:hypothetical protein
MDRGSNLVGADTSTQISFWIRASVAQVAGDYTLTFYSDNLTTVVATVPIPDIPAAAQWQPVTWDKTSAIGQIRTWSLDVLDDKGAVTFLIDDIIWCKGPAEADSLTLTSLISKNTAGEPWFALASINGTGVELDAIGTTPVSAFGVYGGETESVPTYKRETWKSVPAAATGTTVQTISSSGSTGNTTVIAGGYTNGRNVNLDPTGISFFDGANGNGSGVYATGKQYYTVSRLGATRYYIGFYTQGAQTAATFTDCYDAACASKGVSLSASLSFCALDTHISSGSGDSGIVISQSSTDVNPVTVTDCVVQGAAAGGVSILVCRNAVFARNAASACLYSFYLGGVNYGRCEFQDCTAIGSGTGQCAIYGNAVSQKSVVFRNLTSSGHSLYGVNASSNVLVDLCDSSIAEGTETAFGASVSAVVTSTNHDDNPGSHYRWEYGATYNSTQATRHTADGWAWQLSPTNTARDSAWPMRLPLGQIALTSGVPTVVTAWMQRSNAGLTGGLVCPGGQITGMATDISDTSWTVAAGEWEQQSITLQSTESGLVTVEAQCYGGTTYSMYVDDAGSTTTATFTGLDIGTGSGPAYINAAGSSAATATRVTGGVW